MTEDVIRGKLLTREGRHELAALDELSAEMRLGNVANGLYEGDFTAFQPTYKYELGSETEYRLATGIGLRWNDVD